MTFELVIIIGMIASTVFFLIISSNHGFPDILQVFFFFIAFGFLLITMNTAIISASSLSANISNLAKTAYVLTALTFLVTIVYILISTGITVVNNMKEKKRRRLQFLDEK